ncbi:hypothetical protein FGO68_gene6770 [Halteria grandinella]|uniref:SUI1 domain-containing protein n=1 Tax=Halteria grandinella TaxID=5974 RepID=A0A8J8SWY1_HALGN|nr:hypothetical protein FGO68_gene6770 [Halteria grandinella]
MYGGAAQEDEPAQQQEEQPAKQVAGPSKMLAAFAGGDSDEERKKKAKKRERQGKKAKGGKKQQSESEEEEQPASTQATEADKGDDKEEQKVGAGAAPVEKPEFPLQVVYCRVCGVPPEYCMFDKKDSTECKAWVLANHPELHDQIYGAPKPVEEGAAEAAPQQQQKKKKKVSLAPSGDSDVKIYKAKRGGKKVISTVVGLHNYGVPLKDMAKIMGKKFACGAAYQPDDEKYGECIQIQGDVAERFVDLLEAELTKYKVPFDRIKFEEVKKKKKAEAADGDDDGDE